MAKSDNINPSLRLRQWIAAIRWRVCAPRNVTAGDHRPLPRRFNSLTCVFVAPGFRAFQRSCPEKTTFVDTRRSTFHDRSDATSHAHAPAKGHQTDIPALRCRSSSRFTHVCPCKSLPILGMSKWSRCPTLPREPAVAGLRSLSSRICSWRCSVQRTVRLFNRRCGHVFV